MKKIFFSCSDGKSILRWHFAWIEKQHCFLCRYCMNYFYFADVLVLSFFFCIFCKISVAIHIPEVRISYWRILIDLTNSLSVQSSSNLVGFIDGFRLFIHLIFNCVCHNENLSITIGSRLLKARSTKHEVIKSANQHLFNRERLDGPQG